MKKKSSGVKQNKNKKKLKTKSNKALSVLGIVLLIALFLYLYKSLHFVQDDAYITFRYVKNFIAGHGLVFNIGEYVEGYTNFLWLLILSLTTILGFGIELTSTNLSIFFGIISIVLTYNLTSSVLKSADDSTSTTNKTLVALIPSSLLILTNSFGYWAVSGMETTLFISLIMISILIYFNQPEGRLKYSLPVIMFFTYLLRPEGILIFLLIYTHKAFYVFLRKNNFKTDIKKYIADVILFLLLVAIYTTFRLLYFGYPLPNTYYAKSGSSLIYFRTGLDYFLNFCRANLLYGFILIIPLYLFFKKRMDRKISFLIYFVFSYCLAVILLGGDVLAFYRFLLPVTPIIYLLFTLSIFFISTDITRKDPSINKKALQLVMFIILVLPSVYNYITERPKTEGSWVNEVELVKKMKIKADLIEKRQIESGRQITVAATTIGALSYFTDANVIDMLGLTDKFISHNPKEIPSISGTNDIGWKERKYNADYILKRKPDHIIFSTGAKPSAYAERALFTKAEFFQKYYPEQILVPEAGSSIIIYSRKEKFPDEPQDTLTSIETINVKFIDHYVAASSLLTKFENNKDPFTGDKLVKECTVTNRLCPTFFSDGYRILGRYYLLVNDLEKSKENLLRSIQIDDMNSIAHSGLAVVYAKEKNMQSANYHYLKAIKFSPDLLTR